MHGLQTRPALKVWIVAALAGAIATAWPAPLALDVALVREGELWRVWTGHFAHLSWRHYVFDMTALVLVLRFCQEVGMQGARLAVTALLSASLASLVIVVFRPVEVYGGISAVTVALLTAAALESGGRGTKLPGAALLLVVMAKIAAETSGVSASGILPLWQAHLAGMAMGVMVHVYPYLRQTKRRIPCHDA